jgi:hypothetical protein
MNTNYEEIDDDFEAKYHATFETFSQRLEEHGATVEEDGDWVKWNSVVNMLDDK